MADEEQIDPGSGRIIGAGGNDLQKSIDANTRALNQLLAELAKERKQTRSGSVGSSNPSTTSVTPGVDAPPRWVNRGNTINAATGYSTYRPSGAGRSSSGANLRTFVSGTSGPASVRMPGSATNEERHGEDGSYYSSRARTVTDQWGRDVNQTFSMSRSAGGDTTHTTTVRSPRPDGRGYSTRVRTTSTSAEGQVSRSEHTTNELNDLSGDNSDWSERNFHGGWGPTGRTTSPSTASLNGGTYSWGPAGGGSGTYSGTTYTPNWKGAAKVAKQAQTFGNAQLKLALPLDNYSQWAAIQQGSPYGSDGTNGGSVNAIRKAVFGSQGQNQTMWASSAQDATNAAFLASRNSGYQVLTPGTNTINPQFSNYMGQIKDLSIVNPMYNAADTAKTVGQLSSTRGIYASMMYGYKPLIGAGGSIDRNAMGSFADSVMQRAWGKSSVSSDVLTASMKQNGGVLNSNITAYVNAAGGDANTVNQLEDYITARNTALQKGFSSKDFTSAMSAYQAGGSGADAASAQLKKMGITNSMLQSQKDVTASKTTNTSDLLDSFGPALKNANEALAKFYNVLNSIINMPGIKQTVGTAGGWGSVLGGAASGFLGLLAGNSATVSRAATGVGRTIASAASRIGSVAEGASLAEVGATIGKFVVGGGEIAAVSAVGSEHRSRDGQMFNAFAAWEKVHHPGTRKMSQRNSDWSEFQKGWDSGQITTANAGSTSSRTTGNDGINGGMIDASGSDGGGSSSTSSGTAGGRLTSGTAVTGKTAAGAISSALAELGKPYEWGGTGPDSWDCSGLMQHAYASIGVSIPRTSQKQMKVGQPVDRKDVQPGDLMFPYAGHVVMYLGNGKIVEAPHTGANVRIASVNEYSSYAAIRRIVGSVGTLSSLATSSTSALQSSQVDNSGGDSGAVGIGSGDYGSSEEVDTIAGALSAFAGVLNSTGQTASSSQTSSSSSSSSSSSTDLSGVSTSGPWKKDTASITKAKALGKSLAAAKGWKGDEWTALESLWQGESAWKWWIANSSSGAFGIPQALPGSKMASAGKDWKTNPQTQIDWGLKYIKDRYGDPINAYSTWKSRTPHWYDTGAWEIPNDQTAVVHKGEMIIEKPKADTIRNALMKDVVNVKDAATGSSSSASSGTIHLNFANGAVQFTVNGPMTESQAQQAGASFTQALVQDARMKSLAKGL